MINKRFNDEKSFSLSVFFYFWLDIGDGQLEVVGLENSLYVGQIIAGVRAHGLRLAQCASITIR